jgi:hypothetical protein
MLSIFYSSHARKVIRSITALRDHMHSLANTIPILVPEALFVDYEPVQYISARERG